MMNVFENEINELQQGSIFSGAKADGFEGQKAYGLIITPRCDIAVVAGVDYVGGLEFDYAIFVGVDESRVPPRLSQKKSDFYFSNYAWHKKIYVALTRARYGVYLLGESSQGISPILETAITENPIEVKK